MNLTFRQFCDFPPNAAQILAASELVFQSFDFYKDLPILHSACLQMISEEFTMPDTECYNPLLAIAEHEVVGIVCYYPAAQLEARQKSSMLSVMRKLGRAERKAFNTKRRSANNSVEPASGGDGIYISRVAISTNHRGTGIGTQLMRKLVDTNNKQRMKLHVDKDNAAAILFYQNFGFRFREPTLFTKRVMNYSLT